MPIRPSVLRCAMVGHCITVSRQRISGTEGPFKYLAAAVVQLFWVFMKVLLPCAVYVFKLEVHGFQCCLIHVSAALTTKLHVVM